MVCPFKKEIVKKYEYTYSGTISKEIITTTFGECEEYNCPHYRSVRECGLMRGNR